MCCISLLTYLHQQINDLVNHFTIDQTNFESGSKALNIILIHLKYFLFELAVTQHLRRLSHDVFYGHRTSSAMAFYQD